LLLLSLLLPLHSCQLASIDCFLVVQWNINQIIIIRSLLELLLVNLDGPCAIEEVVSLLLLALQEQSIKVLMLFNKFLLRTRRLELMRPDLQRHLLAVLLLLLLRGIVRDLTLLRGAIVNHVVNKALDPTA
jgi:hypothetical protein